MKILIDDREHSSDVADWLRKEKDVEIILQRLSAGDYMVDDRLIFERKTLPDFAASIKDGRLFVQMHRLKQSGKKCALLLEGTSTALQNSQMRREALQGALVHIALQMEIPILRSMHAQESASLMLYAARQVATSTEKNHIVKRHQPHKIGSKQQRQLYLLQGLPGIGTQRAKALLDKFGSIEKMLMADEKALTSIPGIGRRTFQDIQWILKEDDMAYGQEFFDL